MKLAQIYSKQSVGNSNTPLLGLYICYVGIRGRSHLLICFKRTWQDSSSSFLKEDYPKEHLYCRKSWIYSDQLLAMQKSQAAILLVNMSKRQHGASTPNMPFTSPFLLAEYCNKVNCQAALSFCQTWTFAVLQP